MHKTIILIAVVNLMLATGCGSETGKKKAMMVFIDYTESAATFENNNSD